MHFYNIKTVLFNPSYTHMQQQEANNIYTSGWMKHIKTWIYKGTVVLYFQSTWKALLREPNLTARCHLSSLPLYRVFLPVKTEQKKKKKQSLILSLQHTMQDASLWASYAEMAFVNYFDANRIFWGFLLICIKIYFWSQLIKQTGNLVFCRI